MSVTKTNSSEIENSNPHLLRDAIQDFLFQRQQVAKGFDRPNWLQTGFRDFDQAIGGLRLGSLTTLASRPSMGRSALALNIASNLAVSKNIGVLYLSLEMPVQHLTARLLSQLALVEVRDLYESHVDWSQDQEMNVAIQRIASVPLSLLHCPYVDVESICDKVRQLKKTTPLTLLVIDDLAYVNLSINESQAIASYEAAMQALKYLASELKIAILLLSPLNRDLEDRENKRPIFSDLPSVAIAKHSDMLLFLYRDEVYDPEGENRNKAELIVARNDFGPMGVIHLGVELKCHRFLNL